MRGQLVGSPRVADSELNGARNTTCGLAMVQVWGRFIILTLVYFDDKHPTRQIGIDGQGAMAPRSDPARQASSRPPPFDQH